MRGFDVNRFVGERTAEWQRLESVLRKAEDQGLRSLQLADARELSKLYRAVSSDLIRARTEQVNAAIVDYLNDLVARGYAVLHAREVSAEKRVAELFLRGFPRLLRREARLVLLAAALLLLGALVGATFVAIDPHALGALIPDMHQTHTPGERVGRDEKTGGDARGDQAAAFSGWLFTHNIQVSFTVFALGLSFGIGTIALLFYNGVPLGALAMQYHQAGQGLFFWAWILPHGVTELTVVCIAGAAGLVLARALWLPGRSTRREALTREAGTAVRLVVGGMPLLVLAGVIEGTISQMHAPKISYEAKLLFAAAVAVGVYYYLLCAGASSAQKISSSASSPLDSSSSSSSPPSSSPPLPPSPVRLSGSGSRLRER